MRRCRAVLFAVLSLVVFAATASAQGFNWGGTAALSWNRDTIVPSLASPCGVPRLYVRVSGIAEVKGAEFGITWTPSEAAAAFTLGSASFPTAAYGTCTFLARDTVITIVTEPDTSGVRFSVASAWSGLELACTSGNVAQMPILFDDGCSTTPIHFTLTYCRVIDHQSRINDMTVTGGADITFSPVATLPATWGSIKALYH